MTRSVVRLVVLVSIVTSVAMAQTRRVVTAADYDRAVRMLAPALNGLVVGGTADATWLPDGRFWYVRTTLTGTENVVVDPVKKTREVVATPPAGGQRRPAGGRGGRGGGGGGRGGGRGGVAITKTCGPNVTGMTGPPPPSMSPDGSKAALHLRLESLGARRRDRPGAPAHDGRREGLRLRDEQRRLDDERGAVALVVAGRQEDRDAAAGRAQGRRDVPGADAGQRRAPGASRVEIPAPRRSATWR